MTDEKRIADIETRYAGHNDVSWLITELRASQAHLAEAVVLIRRATNGVWVNSEAVSFLAKVKP